MAIFANKRHVAPNLNLVNVRNHNRVLRSKVFVSADRQLRAVYLILDFQPLFDKFQDMGYAIRAGDRWLAQIDVLVLGFLAQEDIVPVDLPAHRFPCEVAVLREETASLRLSLEVEIDQFHLKGEE